ncbi:M1 family aminopeptidase [Flavimarina sp. Hel_I_48]|uniref:M1 family aminopeptidase n=1 Tax=Flavimarina sp. Hel_I_48 TaxID=1392488 RepID=UPI0004DF3488|nr:M1 family aminopeptidase [Flavimarina sp. Hel_I_48]
MKTVLTLSLLLSIIVLSCKSEKVQPDLLSNGISENLAIYRKNQVDGVIYRLDFKIPLQQEDSIPAKLELNLNINTLDQPLYLDFKEKKENLISVSVNGKNIPIDYREQHLIIDQKHLKIGENILKIDFIAGELSLNRNPDFLYTLLVPDRASTVFPCFDQPNIKAEYILHITAPKDWNVMAGAPEEKTIEKDDFTEHQFGKTDKMSTYLFSFVAGKFEEAISEKEDLTMHMLYRETDPEKIEYSVDTIFDLHQQSVDFLEDYTGHPFPFQKLDFAAIPVFQYGGMEHVGAIQYRESSLFLDHTATESQKLSRGKLIAHETSHMWFGDLVTMQWFNDVWMKEVFANFMADKIANPAFPDINHDLLFVLNHYPSAYGEDRTRGTNPIRQDLENLKDAGSLYGAIIYNKAPIMMRQLELAVGKEKFRESIREYIKTYAYDNADWNNLIEILDGKTALDMKKWSAIWVNQSGRPVFSDDVKYDKDTISSFEILQQAEDGSDKIWPQTFKIGLIYPNSTRIFTVNLTDRKTQINEIEGLPKPQNIIYNYDGLGYGVFPLAENTVMQIPQIKDEVARAYSYINSYEKTLNGEIDVLAEFKLLEEGLKSEKNEFILNLISSELQSIFWHFLTPEQRDDHQKELETLVYNALKNNLKPNIKKTLFNVFSNVAYSEEGREKLYKIWKKDTKIADLRLNEDDFTAMAQDLAVYKHPKRAEILEQTEDFISNPDKKKRFQFLLPALSEDENERDAFFNSFKEEKNREKESWVTAAANLINHPLRQQSAIKHIQLSQDLVEEIQRTGDIFFPKAWLNSTIGNYSGKEAYDILQNFLTSHPDFSPILKKKLLQATDDLYRVQSIRIDKK